MKDILPTLKNIAERAIRENSFLFNPEEMEQALTVMKQAVQHDFYRVSVSNINGEIDQIEEKGILADGSKYGCNLYPIFLNYPPQDRVITLIHEFIHIYLDFSNLNAGHTSEFLSLFRTVIRNTYPNRKVWEHHYGAIGTAKYMIKNGIESEEGYFIFCPKCFSRCLYNEKCEFCGYAFL